MSEPQAESALDECIGIAENGSGITPEVERLCAAARAELAAQRSAVSAAYLAGQLAMRERCAKVCDERASQCADAIANSVDLDMASRYRIRHESACYFAERLRALSPEEHRP